jgi:transposase
MLLQEITDNTNPLKLKGMNMLHRREMTLDWLSEQVYRVAPLSDDLQRMKDLFPEQAIMDAVRPYYSPDMGRQSEDPVLLSKILFLSFVYDVTGDRNTLDTLRNRIDWHQFCDLRLDEALPDRSTLVKFRRQVGLSVIERMFQAFLVLLVDRGLLDLQHRFFDGTPVRARASINPYRDEVYTELLASIEAKLQQFHAQQVELDPSLNTTPVALTKTTYSSDNAAVDARRSQKMKPVSQRQSAGDPDARFQRGKQGKRSELGYEVFFSTDGKQLFIEDVQVAAEASQGAQLFLDKLEQSEQGQIWSVDAEFAQGDILTKAEEKGVSLNTPPRQVTSHGKFSKTEFRYDTESDTYTCPAGYLLSHRGTNRKLGERHYRPEVGTCEACPLREACTTSKTGRTVTRNRHEAEWERQRDHARTPEAVMGKVLRGIIAEGKFAEALRHGLKRMRYVGKEMARMQSTLVAFILNVKRFLRLEAQGVIT